MSIDPVSVAKGIGEVVAGPAIQASKEWIKYVNDCEVNVKTVQELHHNLEILREEVGWKVELGNMQSQDVVPEVTEWIEGVDDFIGSKKEWKELLKDKEARKKAEKCCFGFGWSPRYRHNLSKKAEEKAIATRKKIEKMKNRGQEPVTRDAKPVKLSSFTSSAFCKGLESREKKLTEILEVLDSDKVNRIGIHGMGGSGKTTLIQELARQAEDDKLFNAVIIAEISQFPDYKRIQDQIAERIGFTTLDRYHNIEERALNLGKRLRDLNRMKGLSDDGEQHGPNKGGRREDENEGEGKKKLDKHPTKKNLKKPDEKGLDEKVQSKYKNMDVNKDEGEGDRAIKGKKTNEKDTRGLTLVGQAEKSGKMLVILDNMWKKLDLHLIGIPYELQKDLGCKIIVISRSEDVCKAMDASGSCTFKLGDLNDKEADHLFRDRVGTIVDDADHKEISKKLLKKCSRLPLSINVLADTLKNQTLSVWERVLRQLEKPILGETLGVLGDTYSIIELSYNYLGNKEKKMFFLLCCLFPPGSSVHIDDLLKYGIGMGLFQYVNSVVEATDQAYKWADDLKSLSLLMDVDVIKGVIHIHDDVREAGKSFAAKGNQAFHVGAIPRWLLKDSYENYTIISMVSSNSYEYLSGRRLPKLQLLRSLGLSCSKLGEDYFLGMQTLKVLDMSKSDIKALPSSFEKLENLVTLLFEYCSLEDVTRVSKLVKLQVLSFRGSNITRLPREMEALVELKLLDLTNCKQLKQIPFGIFGCLLKLEGLYMKHSFSNWKIKGSMASLSELTHLPLHVLEITIQDISQLLDGDLPVLNLSNYKIDLVVSTKSISQLSDDDLPISSLPDNVKNRAATTKITENKRTLASLQQEQSFSRDLLLGGVHAHNLIREGWKPLMNKAESLYLKKIEGLENIAPYLGEYGWRELKRIFVSECPEMDCIINRKADYQSAVFPKLEMLRLENLPALEAIYQGKSPPPELFSNLQELSLSYLNQLRSSALAVQHATRLKVVEVKNCENLESIFFSSTTMQFGGRRETKSSNEMQFPCLRKLILANLVAFQGLFTKTNQDDTNKLFYPNQVAFPVLDKIKLERLGEIEQIWDMATGKEFATTFPVLRSVSLAYMDKLQHIWSAELCNPDLISFKKMKKLKIRDCGSLEFVCPASVALGFLELELLRIVSCAEIERVIAAERSEGEIDGTSVSSKKMTISFPKLLNIDLVSLSSLVYFYKGRMITEFPALKNLKLDDILNLKTLTKVKRISKETPYPEDEYYILFNKESKFPCLERLYAKSMYIEGLWNIKINQFSLVFPNLQSLSLQDMYDLKHVWTKELTGATQVSINLKEIEISSCGSLKSLLPSASAASSTSTVAEEVKLIFPELHSIKVESSGNFKYVLEGNVNLAFPALKTIILRDLDEMVTFAKLDKMESPKSEEDSEDGDDRLIPLFNEKIDLSFLEELQVAQLPNIEKLWGMTRFDEFSKAFTSLRTLAIEWLPQLKYVWSYDPTEESLYSGSLETIAVTYCEEIESMFSCSKETSTAPPQPGQSKVISLPKLKKLILMHLENFRCLFQGYINMEFQGLKGLEINELPLVKTLVKLRNSCDSEKEIKTDKAKEELEREKDDDSVDEVLFKGNVEFSSLEELKIECMPELESIYETGGGNVVDYTSIFPKLKTLHLTGENDVLKQLSSEAMLHKLTSLAIRKFSQFKYIVSSSSKGDQDALVKSLSILGNLKELIVEDCESLEELFEGQDATLMLSSLIKLELSGLPKLKYVQWHLLPNLQSLHIADETSLGGKKFLISATEVAAGGSSILQSLESLEISDFAEIEAIIGVEEEGDQFQKDGHEIMFPKLKEVKIGRMISLYTFCSISFPMCLPSLVSIDFNGCDNLRSFSVAPMVIPKQFSLRLNDEAIDVDVNNILELEFDWTDKVADYWPRKVASKLHPEHRLSLKNWRNFGCDECREIGGRYSYTCNNCDFDLHPHCALKESQLIEEPDEMKVGKDLPQTVDHVSHADHELKLVAGRDYTCDECSQMGELFAYSCEECDFDMHPKCALKTPSPIKVLQKQDEGLTSEQA